jgi:hypothetical protein
MHLHAVGIQCTCKALIMRFRPLFRPEDERARNTFKNGEVCLCVRAHTHGRARAVLNGLAKSRLDYVEGHVTTDVTRDTGVLDN